MLYISSLTFSVRYFHRSFIQTNVSTLVLLIFYIHKERFFLKNYKNYTLLSLLKNYTGNDFREIAILSSRKKLIVYVSKYHLM